MNGGAYSVEVPQNWNHHLVMYIRGGEEYSNAPSLEIPPLREYLLVHGYAWASTSQDRTDLIGSAAADQTAALWDLFVEKHERPERTYVVGLSAGGAGAVISAERYSNRYYGVLDLCGVESVQTTYDSDIAVFLAAAYVANVDQAYFDAHSVTDIMNSRIAPALQNNDERERIISIWTQLTGGSRPLAREGFLSRTDSSVAVAATDLEQGLVDNRHTVYELPISSSEVQDDFNRRVIRIGRSAPVAPLDEEQDPTGHLKIPLLTLHTTGDSRVPLVHEQLLRRLVDDAGRSDYLVQRTVRDQDHCGFVDAEEQAAFEALVHWVEDGVKPAGEDLLADVRGIRFGNDYRLSARIGSPEAALVPGAKDRMLLQGDVTIFGQSPPDHDIYFPALVLRDGLVTQCNIDYERPTANGYRRIVASDSEMHGCGIDGADVALAIDPDETHLLLSSPVAWLADSLNPGAAVQIVIGGRKIIATQFSGAIYAKDGSRMPGGTTVDAYIGNKLCGRGSIPYTGALGGSYLIVVVGSDSVEGCDSGATVTFRVNGSPVRQTAKNEFDGYLTARVDLYMS